MPDQEPQGQESGSGLASFGDELRREREIRGISLKEIADATKISKRFLEAIERNDYKTLPAPVFTRGFVREYARYVGLNAEEVVNRYNFAMARDDRIEKPPEIQKYPETPVRDITPRPPAKRGIPPLWARVNRNLLALVLIVAALAAVVVWAVKQKHLDLEPFADAVTTIPVPTRTLPPPRTITASAPRPAPLDDSVLRLSIDTVDNSWVILQADGERVLNAELEPGDRRSFQAKNQFRFETVGNAAGLSLTLNGIEVPALGRDGQVRRDVVFDRAVLDELRRDRRQAAPPREP